MIADQIDNLQALREYLQDESCQTHEPFMKLGAGTAPVLDYNLPQCISFSTYGDVQIPVNVSYFADKCTQPPTNNYFSNVEETESDEILLQDIMEAVQLQNTGNLLVANVGLIRKNLDADHTDLEAIANQVSDNTTKLTAKNTYLNEKQLAKFARNGLQPVVVEKLNGYGSKVRFLKEPQEENITPRIYIIEEYKTSTFLGRYGAGKTLQTFSLLPGEKTTITIRTYRDQTSTKTQSENLLDSVSQSSIDEMEKLLEEECGMDNSVTETKTDGVKVDVSLSAKLFKIVSASVSAGYNHEKSVTASRSSNSRALNRALEKHVAQSNTSRNIEINTTTSEEVHEGEETTTVRELQNINKSRVLNFVFRQLLQEYISITYLSNIKIAYTNGYLDSLLVVDVEDLDELLEDIIIEDYRTSVKTSILKKYLSVSNYEGDMVRFLEEKTVSYDNHFEEGLTESYWTRTQNKDTYGEGDSAIEVPGVILQVQTNILRTPSLVVDALLGQGQALDCFNIKAQDAIAVGENLKNLELLQKLEIVEGITEAEQKAELYKKVFGECCDCPQTQIING